MTDPFDPLGPFDPFDALRAPLSPVAPDPDFARRLRARIDRVFTLPKGVTVSNLDLDTRDQLETKTDVTRLAGVAARSDVPVSTRAAITPYLAIAGAAEAIEWYGVAFGARPVGAPIIMPDGRVGHAELDIAGAVIMLADEHPEIGHTAPTEDLGVHVTLHLSVEDVDAVIDRAVSAGAHLERPPGDHEYGRNGAIRDPFGHRWIISAEPSDLPEAEPEVPAVRQGDIAYASLWVPDVRRAAEFFSSVLGWRYREASGPQGRQVDGLPMHHGIWEGEPRSTLFCCYAVDDLESAIERVRSAGGTAEEPHVEPYGTISECVDDEGVHFALFLPPGTGTAQSAGAEATSAGVSAQTHGTLAYVTMEVRDSARTRTFYGSVLGWRFAPGSVDDGWQVQDVAPMVGISGGHELVTTVPMYQVADIASAVERIRRAGGTATEPEVQPYGITSTCTDDQGTRFYLGEL